MRSFCGEMWSSTVLAPYALLLLTLAAFSGTIIRGGSLPVVSGFEMWGRAAWHACSKRCLGCCWPDCMHNAFLRCEGVNQGP